MDKNSQNITVGIYTCFGGPSLVSAVKSIRSAQKGGEVEIVIFADGNPISSDILEELELLKAKVIERKGLSSVVVKIKNLVFLAGGGIIILTQDDVIFDEKAIVETEKVFQENNEVTMVGSKIIPMRAETIFESILEIGVGLVQRIGRQWKSGDNYLLSNGRCLSFRTEAIKNFSFPEKIMNADAYFYFENKKRGGKFNFAEKSIVYNRSPLTLKEHFNQSSRFQTSKAELVGYFGAKMLEEEYKIPAGIFVREVLRMLFRHPLRSMAHLAISLYTRLKPRKTAEVINPVWKADESTKRL